MSLPKDLDLALIGGGNMARGLIGGLLGGGLSPARITVAEPLEGARATLTRDFGVKVTGDNAAAAAAARIVVLAVKPQLMPVVARALAPAVAHRPLVISVAAGIRAADLVRWLAHEEKSGQSTNKGVKVVRAMPNRPALTGAGATGLYAGPGVSAAERELAERVLAPTGLCLWVESEEDLDTVTALSGSGPAYFFRLAELMAENAVAMGLDPATARALAAQTLAGAGALVAAEASPDLARMRAEVASRGGTTEAALQVFDARGLGELARAAQEAAARRSRELAEQFGAQ